MASAYGVLSDDTAPESKRSMKKCTRKLKLMVPKLRGRKRVRQLDLIQNVIEYIRYLELIISENESQIPSLTQPNVISLPQLGGVIE
ncbi:hypothetical protein ACTXT7_009949 [Hymenolepis weldensis]